MVPLTPLIGRYQGGGSTIHKPPGLPIAPHPSLFSCNWAQNNNTHTKIKSRIWLLVSVKSPELIFHPDQILLLIPYAVNWQTSDGSQSFELTLKDSTASGFGSNPPQICSFDVSSVSDACHLLFQPSEHLGWKGEHIFPRNKERKKERQQYSVLPLNSTKAGFPGSGLLFYIVTSSKWGKSNTNLLTLIFFAAHTEKNAESNQEHP